MHLQGIYDIIHNTFVQINRKLYSVKDKRRSENMEENRQIWIKDLLYGVLRGWRFILIAMLIGAVLLNGLGFVKANNNYRAKMASYEKTDSDRVQSEMDRLEESLTQDQISKVRALAMYTEDCQSNYDALLNYMDSSIRFNVDPNCVPTVEMQFLVDSHYEVTYPVINQTNHTNDIMAGYENVLSGEEICNAMANAVNQSKDASVFQELVETFHEDENVLHIRVIAENRENCEKLADVVEKAISDQTPVLQQVYGNFSATLASRIYAERVDKDLLSEHMTLAASLKDLTKQSADLTTSLSTDEKDYYKLLLSDHSENGNMQEMDKPSRPGMIYPKNLVLGLMLGFFIACVWLYLKIVMSGTMLAPADCGNKVLAVVPVQDRKKRPLAFVDRWLRKLFYGKDAVASEEKRMEMAVSAARIAMEKSDMKHVYVSGTSEDREVERVKKAICSKLSTQIVEVISVESLLTDPAVLPQLTKADGVIIVERIGVSCYSDMRAQKTICEGNDVPIIGCVALR